MLTVRALRYHRWRWAIGLGLSALLLLACATGVLAFIAPALVYGVWSGPAQLAPRDGQPPRQSARRQRMLVLATLSVVLLFTAHPLIVGGATTQGGANLGILLMTSAATLASGAAWGMGLLDALRERRWSWLIWLPVGLVAALALFYLGLYQVFVDTSVGALYTSSPEGQATALMGFLAGPALLLGALIYGLWAAPSRRPALADKQRLVPMYVGAQGTSILSAPAQARPTAPAPQYRPPAPPPPTPAGGQPYGPQQPYQPAPWPASAQTQQPWQPAPPPAGQPQDRPGFPLAQPGAVPPPAYAPTM